MAKKGSKNAPGVPEIWDEVKGRVTMTLTPTAVKGLDTLARMMDLSRSEFVERIGRGLIPVMEQPDKEEQENTAFE